MAIAYSCGHLRYYIFLQEGDNSHGDESDSNIWGYLVKLKWKESRIWLVQAFLFMMGHIYYLGSHNLAFFIGVPITALILGLLAWKSRSIGTSMTTHALVNTFGDLISHYRW